jgi:hypothetical protein
MATLPRWCAVYRKATAPNASLEGDGRATAGAKHAATRLAVWTRTSRMAEPPHIPQSAVSHAAAAVSHMVVLPVLGHEGQGDLALMRRGPGRRRLLAVLARQLAGRAELCRQRHAHADGACQMLRCARARVRERRGEASNVLGDSPSSSSKVSSPASFRTSTGTSGVFVSLRPRSWLGSDTSLLPAARHGPRAESGLGSAAEAAAEAAAAQPVLEARRTRQPYSRSSRRPCSSCPSRCCGKRWQAAAQGRSPIGGVHQRCAGGRPGPARPTRPAGARTWYLPWPLASPGLELLAPPPGARCSVGRASCAPCRCGLWAHCA